MKILMVAPTPFFADRGCHVRILGEIQGLQALGHEVVLCTYPLGRDVAGVRTVRTWPVPWYRKLSAGPSWQKYYIDVMLLGLVRRWIRRWRPDIVHAHLHEGACIAAWALGKRRIPLILDYQGSLTDEVVAHRFTRPGRLQHRIMARLESWINRRADVVITSTSKATEAVVSRDHVPPHRVQAVPDGVDVELFRPIRNGRTVRMLYGIPNGRPILVYTGVLSAYQGIDLFLEALRELKRAKQECHALMVGYPNVDEYREKAKQLGVDDRTTFTGRVPFENVPELLAAADIGVSAKLPGSEGNVKLYTYLAAGLPTVAFDTPMNREILGEAGVLVPQVTAGALADGLGRLLQEGARASRLKVLARQRAVDRFAWRSVAARLVTIYQTVSSAQAQKGAR